MAKSLTSVNRSISEFVTFIKDNINTNLHEASVNGSVNVENEELIKISRIVDLSVSEGFSLGYKNVESSLNEYKNQLSSNERNTKKK
jgi:hypothetical protein